MLLFTKLCPTTFTLRISMQNPENLLIFAAGNDGWYTDRDVCTTNSPGIAKNVLAIGATSSGETRLTTTSENGKIADGTNGLADISTIAAYSSYGPTQDGRIKPEVVAPGDSVSRLFLRSEVCVLRWMEQISLSSLSIYHSRQLCRECYGDVIEPCDNA